MFRLSGLLGLIGWTYGQSAAVTSQARHLPRLWSVKEILYYEAFTAPAGETRCPNGQPVCTSRTARPTLLECATGSGIDMVFQLCRLSPTGQDEVFAMGYRHQRFWSFGFGRGTLFRTSRDVMHKTDGVSAVEFALLAPMLIFAILATVDLGLAISERMTIGHILRAGAQSAIENVGDSQISLVMRTTAAKNLTVADTGTDTSIALAVEKMCACSAQPSVAVACSTTCTPNAPTQIYYILTGSKTYAGLILPRFKQSKTLEVQVR